MAQQNRLVGLDNLRVMMIILHCSMTYMDYRPAWWYVTDNDTYIGFTLLVVILDAFPMTVLFLLAGYFAYPSFQQHGRYAFIKNKLLRIAIPWLIGVLFITPFFSRETSIALGYSSVPIYHYFTSYFFTPLYQQAHYWFLGILWLFFMLYAFWPKHKNGNVTTKSLPPYLLIMLTGLITFIGYYLSIKYYKPALDWSNLGYIFYFQPAKLVGYIAVFVLGIYGRQQQWFTKAGWKPGRIYLVMAVLSIILFIYWRFILISTANQSFDSIIDSLSYSLVSLCVPFGIIAVFINKVTITYQYPLSLFSPYSYGIYWLHLIIAVLIMQYLSETDLNIVIKWILSVLMTLIISTLLTKLVLKKRIFIDDRHIQR